MRKTRLKKREERKNITTIILSILGILIVFFVLIKYGLSFLVSFSLFLSSGKNQVQTSQNNINYITPPVLDPTLVATNSAKITISGKALKDLKINLYVNNQNQAQTTSDEKGYFSFEVNLVQGENQIKALAESNNKKSDFSNVLTVLFKDSKPFLSVNFPKDGQSFKQDQNTVNVQGSTDAGTSVTVNGFWAVIDENNNFSYILPLQNGDNQIKVVATDQAGNQTEKDLKVNYSQ